ncbi:unnamed protein product [Rotaria socialis]|uniref:Craniofacial development protein 2-like n=1 Tax=Rotaria socialis TaxID=392032 RepID=A0A821DXN8_9BILA|nr:unnamed protein product [Rotaria socialis]CAF4627998.1 unnamed protein product [Rotaria socialis]
MQTATAWKNLGSTWEAANERIVMVRLACKPINVSVIAAYAPINSKNQQMASTTSDPFYADLQTTLDKVPKSGMVLIIGDFNARIGVQQHPTSRIVVGPYAVDTINENGKHGEILTNSKERLDRWKDYFNGLLNVPSNVDPLTIQQIIPSTIDPNEQRRQDKAPSLKEVQCAIKQMKNGKASGNNGISPDIIKVGGLPIAK